MTQTNLIWEEMRSFKYIQWGANSVLEPSIESMLFNIAQLITVVEEQQKEIAALKALLPEQKDNVSTL